MPESTVREGAHRQRAQALDALRGAAVISMIAFHALYDSVCLFGTEAPWFSNPLFRSVWAASISWTFLILAGWMTVFSRSNLKRACVYGVAAFGVWAATATVRLDTPISYGILFCMSASTLLFLLIRPLAERMPPWTGMLLASVAALVTWHVPEATYPVEHLAWLGLPSAAFASGDYYPVLPYAFLFLIGAFLGRVALSAFPAGYPAWMIRDPCPLLSAIGRASLPIYLLHQPALLLLLRLYIR